MRPVMMPCGVRCWKGVSVVSSSHRTMPRLQRTQMHDQLTRASTTRPCLTASSASV